MLGLTCSFGFSNLVLSTTYMEEIFKPYNQDLITNSFIRD